METLINGAFNLKKILPMFIFAAFLLALPASATPFNDVTTPSGSLLELSNGLRYSVEAATRVESIIVYDTRIDFGVSRGSIIYLTSPDKSNFTVSNSGCKAPVITCGRTESLIVIECLNSNLDQHTLTITPGGSNTCVESTGSESGGAVSAGSGGGTGSVPFATRAPSPTQSAVPKEPAKPAKAEVKTEAKPTASPKIAARKPAFVFKKSLRLGARGIDVEQLQTALAAFRMLKLSDAPKGIFDKHTANALKKMQKEFSLKTTDFLDAKTRKKLNGLNSDSDGDGLRNGEETLIWFSDPSNPDTDGDGYLDGVEVTNGYDPLGPGKMIN